MLGMILFYSHLLHNIFTAIKFWKFTLLIKNPIFQSNQLCILVYSKGPKWQHVSQICFPTLILQKITKLINSKGWEKNKLGIWNPYKFFDVCLTKFKTIKIYWIKSATNFYRKLLAADLSNGALSPTRWRYQYQV